MVKALAFSLLAAAEAGTLAVTWEDCGSQHSKITDLQPTTIKTGGTTTLTGTGTVDEDVTSAKFTAAIKADGVKVATCSGDATTDIVCKLPLGAGVITVKAVEYPLKAGEVPITVDVKTIAIIPASFENVDTHIEAVDQNGESVICMDVHTKKAKLDSDATWEAWKQEHGRVYNGVEEDSFRRSVFEANLEEAAKLQEENPLAEFGSTKYSDWTREEIKERLTNYVSSGESLPEMDLSELPLDVAASKDWTGTYTTSVKDQGQCGSCWAFSAVEQVESDLMREHGREITMSTQELVDCTGSGGRRNGCQGGDPAAAYKVIEQLGGIETESSYRYTARNGNCQFSRSKVAAKVSSYKSVGRGSESSMKSYVGSTGPLSVCVDANSWNSYRSGIMTSCGNSVDHCVQIVGYGTSGSTNYWKVRNSWGRNWGESGHMRLKIGSNLCKINSEPSAVTVSASAVEV